MKEKILIIIGSKSDTKVVSGCEELLQEFGIAFKREISSAHRRPGSTIELVKKAEADGIKVIIAAAGMAAALPGFIASQTILPVIGIPLADSNLGGLDSLLSMVQMPAGVPVATMAIGSHGARNAALFAIEILALTDEKLKARLKVYREKMGGV